MADFSIISQVSATLKALLWDGFARDTTITQHIGSQASIVLEPPREVASLQHGRTVSLWLYQVCEDEFMKNSPTRRAVNDRDEQPTPLALDLSYLLTINTADVAGDQRVLGRALQILHDNARLRIEAEDGSGADEVSLVFARRSLEELTRVWDALREPYRLSVCVDVRVVRIDSTRVLSAGRVADRAVREEALAPQ